jgi:hypothetical protein
MIDSTKALAGLAELAADLQVKGVQAGLRRPGAALAREAKALAPVRTGRLQKSITARALTRAAGNRIGIFDGAAAGVTAGVLVGPNAKVDGRSGSRAFAIVVGGAKPHEESPRRIGKRNKSGRMVLSFGPGKGAVSGPIQHPGARANPFMQRAIDATASQIEPLFYAGLAAFVNKQG